MSGMPYLIKHPSGICSAQRKVPERLQTAVPKVLNNGRKRQAYLKRSLGTTVKHQANITIKPVLIDFDRIIREAEALENSKPPARMSLSTAEINRMAEYIYAKTLAWDERIRVGGRDELKRMGIELRKQLLKQEGRDPDPPFYRYEDLPPHGISIEQLNNDREQLEDDLRCMREALALGNVSAVADHTFRSAVRVRHQSRPGQSPPALGIAIMRSYVGALEDIGKRNEGHPVETPAVSHELACARIPKTPS